MSEDGPKPESEGLDAEPRQQPPREAAEPGQPSGSAQPEGPEEEPAPTDFRRNIWLLVFVVIAVGAAWTLSKVASSRAPQPEPEAEPAVNQQPIAIPTPPPDSPPTYAETLQTQRLIMDACIIPVCGAEERTILVPPPYLIRGVPRTPRIFDVTRRAEGFRIEDLVALSLPDEARLPDCSSENQARFEPAGAVDFLNADERIVAVSYGDQTHAYPLRVLVLHQAVRDTVGDCPVLVCWSLPTQLATCLVVPAEDKDVEWDNTGMVFLGNGVFYDHATGSLWDAGSGRAVAGPRAGARLERLPATVHVWSEWRAAHPEVPVLVTGVGVGPDEEDYPYRSAIIQEIERYLTDPRLHYAVPNFDPDAAGGLPAKTFVLGISVGAQRRAYPLEALLATGETAFQQRIGEQKVVFTVTSPRTAYAMDAEGRPLVAPVMLWFGWKSAHPDTELWTPPAESSDAQPLGGDAAEGD